MISFEKQYFSLNRILLLTVGLWPHQQSKLVRLQFISFFGILISGVIVQVSPLCTSKCTFEFIIEILSSIIIILTYLINYIAFGVNIKVLKDLLAQLQHIYDQLKDENEYAIVEKYGYIAKCYTVVLTTLGICFIFVFVVIQYWTSILDIVLPLNESRPCHMQIATEYFIDQQKYLFLIILHMVAVYCIGTIVLIAVGTTLIVFMQHFCGMFRIASYRIERMMKISILKNNPKSKNLILNEIICAVDIHRQAMKLTEQMMSSFEVMMIYSIFIGVLGLSINLFRISQIMSSDSNIKEIILPLTLSITCVLYMFLSNYIGQDIIDHNNYIFVTAYNVQWYKASLNTQRIILFLLQRGTKEFAVHIGGIIVGSLQYFATLVRVSVSYFTVIHATH